MKKKEKKFFEKFAEKATAATGSTPAIIISFSLILVWGLSGPFFHFSEIWQLMINTSTTIITFLMVFLIQKSQNKDSVALHIKLDELVSALEPANNRLVDVEDLTEAELLVLKKYYARLREREKPGKSLIKPRNADKDKHGIENGPERNEEDI